VLALQMSALQESAAKGSHSRSNAEPAASAASKLGKRVRFFITPVLTTGICLAAMLLLIIPLLTLEADARGGGGGGGRGGGGFGGHGGGFGGHGGFAGRGGGMGFAAHGGGLGLGGARSFGMARFGGAGIGARSLGVARFGGAGIGARSLGVARFGGARFGARPFGVARFGGASFGARSFGVARVGGSSIGPRSFAARSFAGRSLTSPRVGVATARLGGTGGRFTTVSAVAGPGIRSANLGHGVFGNRAIANVAWRSHFASARFHGRFFGSSWWPWWRRGLVIGWIGPLFWPYAYYDLFDYVYWPYAYDDFWPYAYDDIYYGIYGNYAYVDPGVGGVGRSASSPARHAARGDGPERRPVSVCNDNAPQLTDWPIERIAEVVEPNDAQRTALDELRAASAKAIDMLKSGCPKDLPSIPTGRLAAMESRLQVMLAAVQTVRPALERFYQALSDEQKARFNVISPGDDPDAAGTAQRDLTKFCDEKAPGVTDLPIDRIAQAVQPTPAQRGALDELKDASVKAAEGLKANCPSYQTLTPTGRVEAMEKRLDATLGSVKTVQPALTKFYGSLSDEQKARFNSLRSASRPLG
jgi:LTXXQ motif family protein